MSRTVRTAAALLTLAALTCGSLGALPFGPRPAPDEGGKGSFLSAVVEWMASWLAPDRISPVVPPEEPSQTKDSSSLDPSGGPGGGH